MGGVQGRPGPVERNERHIGMLSSWLMLPYPLAPLPPPTPFLPPGFFFWQAIGGGLMTVAPALTYSLKARLRLLLPYPCTCIMAAHVLSGCMCTSPCGKVTDQPPGGHEAMLILFA